MSRSCKLALAQRNAATICSSVKMTTRSSQNRGTALRRLMTEYKQLTAGGSYPDITIKLSCFDVDYGLAGSPDGMFTAGQP